MMNEHMNKTAAEDYRAGIRGLIDACNRMQLLGANQSAVADAAVAEWMVELAGYVEAQGRQA